MSHSVTVQRFARNNWRDIPYGGQVEPLEWIRFNSTVEITSDVPTFTLLDSRGSVLLEDLGSFFGHDLDIMAPAQEGEYTVVAKVGTRLDVLGVLGQHEARAAFTVAADAPELPEKPKGEGASASLADLVLGGSGLGDVSKTVKWGAIAAIAVLALVVFTKVK